MFTPAVTTRQTPRSGDTPTGSSLRFAALAEQITGFQMNRTMLFRKLAHGEQTGRPQADPARATTDQSRHTDPATHHRTFAWRLPPAGVAPESSFLLLAEKAAHSATSGS